MDQAEIERVINDRIKELLALERAERLNRLRVSFQDKRDELENLIIRIRAMGSLQNGGCPPLPPLTSQ
jgi:DNA-binding TFAR19-related protein (PDSD5 family)